MVLADTSVWIQHFRKGVPEFADRLSEGLVLMHPFVLGELACRNLKSRAAVLSDLRALPPAKPASNAEALQLIEDRRLLGQGTGLGGCASARLGRLVALRILDTGQNTR